MPGLEQRLAETVEQRKTARTSEEFTRARARETVLREWIALDESAKTAGYSVTPSPFSTSTTSNWVARAGGLPAYITNIAKAMVRSGTSESTAIATAIAAVKRWAAGGGNVHPEVRAAAAKAVAEWEAKRAAAHATSAAKAVAK